MFISENGLNLIKEFEGCILQSYDDYNDKVINAGDTVRGTLTIGWGHVEGVYKGQVITQAQADELLKQDMVRYCKGVDNIIACTPIPFEITQNVYDAFVSFYYNTGSLSTLLAGGSRDKQTVADMLLEYRNKGSQWEAGLLRRRKAEREMFLTGGEVICSSGNYADDPRKEKIKALQHICNLYGAGITEDGIWGVQTDNAVRNLPLAGVPYCTPDLTKWLQLRLGVNADGIFMNETEGALKNWQANHGLAVDGLAGYNTIKSLALA